MAPNKLRNCLGLSCVLIGQNLVPEPPAIIATKTSYTITTSTSNIQMRLYSVQKEAAWIELQNSGVLTIADEKLVDWHEYIPAYKWLMDQMQIRLPNFSGNFPIWAWLRRGYRTNAKEWDSEEPLMLLTFDIPCSRILLSDFGAWHFVLNNWYLSKIESDFDKNFSQEEKEQSWNQIFEKGPEDFGWFNEWQACIDKVFLHEVIDARSFRARVKNETSR